MDALGTNPPLAVARAQRALVLARADPASSAPTLAWRVLGLAARDRGDLTEAVDALRQAVQAADRRDDRVSAAEARMTLSFVLLDLGQTTRALRQSARAARDLTGLPQLRLIAQRALILQRCGRLTSALSMYDEAIPGLRTAEDDVWESRALSNRGILHAFLGDLDAAEADLSRARELRLKLGRDVEAARTLWNLGCLARERGDVVLALERFDAADPVCNMHDQIVGLRLVDRATLMLSIGVVSEAHTLALAARAAFADAGQVADLMECTVLLSRIALAERDGAAAADWARQAQSEAATQSRAAWVLLAEHLEVLAREQLGDANPELVARAARVARALARSRWSDAATEAQLAAARLAIADGQIRRAERLLAAVGDGMGRGSVGLAVRRWQATALLARQRGDSRGAAAAVRRGLSLLARHKASIGATDLQAHVPALGEDLARLGLEIALEGGSAAHVLRELERWRGQELRARPVRPPRDPQLSLAIERLRRATADIGQTDARGAPTAAQRATRTAREREVVRLSRRSPAGVWGPTPAPARVEALRTGLGDRVLVEFFVSGGELLALTLAGERVVDASRGPRLHRLGRAERVHAPLQHLQFALARLAAGRGSDRALQAAQQGARLAALEVDALLVQPLAADLRGDGVVIAPTEAMHAVPWSVLATLAPFPVHLVRSGTAWLSSLAGQERVQGSGSGRLEVFISGPGVTLAPRPTRLPGHSERGPRATQTVSLSGAQATVERALAAIDGASVAHIAAHGTFRADNPLLSALALADGDLTVYDLDALAAPPRLVVLAACHSAIAQVLPGNQLLGVAHSLLTLGSLGVIATTLPTPDEQTATLMDRLHQDLASGLEPAVALHHARRSLDVSTPAGFATSAGFELYGL